jgi:ribonucleoside-diphosphate reductase alpha chain
MNAPDSTKVLSAAVGGLSAGPVDLSGFQVIQRTGKVVQFVPSKIAVAITKAFLATEGSSESARIRQIVAGLVDQVTEAVVRRRPGGGAINIEDIQDQVELALMRGGHHDVARSYVLYREERNRTRAAEAQGKPLENTIHILENGVKVPLDVKRVHALIRGACVGLGDVVNPGLILSETLKNLYDGVPVMEMHKSMVLAARTLLEQDPAYSKVTARLLLHTVREEVLGRETSQDEMRTVYAECFPKLINKGIDLERLDERLGQYDLERLGAAIVADRDLQFDYIGMQTIYDRYLLADRSDSFSDSGRRIELPQTFLMRVAMGLALNEVDREAKAIEFYNLLSSFDFMSSTPTLFNSGTRHSQLSSCYLSTVTDDLVGIYDAIKDNAMLAKYAGGLGNDWTPVRALGSYIKGTNGESQGVIPFLKVVNDTAVAVNQGGLRKGAVACYLETWHLDIEEFLELRKNTGDDRRRTHDMNTANWIPDLFMKRVTEGKSWTLFSPSSVPDLHDKVGREFEKAYVAYEEKAARGDISPSKVVQAKDLWRKMLSMLFETGHPWLTFKDPSNIRSPQQHVGVVHSSNLCTEITLNTSPDEIAVCNLGSVNLLAHMTTDADGKAVLDQAKLKRTIDTAMRMLDNVIDINYYAVKQARDSNLRHRPVGLGLMGFQDCLHTMRVPYASEEALDFADRSMEAVCYYAYSASADLAVERGKYSSYRGSLWDRGILPYDSIALLREERGGYLEVNESITMDWDALRAKIKANGMRNSNCVAIAPTATISNIIGVSACIEPTFQNLYVKSNLSGEFTTINEFLVRDLKKLGLWDQVMVADLKFFDGSVHQIERIPADLRELYATAFEVSPSWIIEAASRRQKWIDQGQSLNVYMAGASGKKLDETYKLAWLRGLKTTYYLRTLSASNAEKSTGKGGELNAVSAHASAPVASMPEPEGAACMLRPGDVGFEECTACQ